MDDVSFLKRGKELKLNAYGSIHFAASGHGYHLEPGVTPGGLLEPGKERVRSGCGLVHAASPRERRRDQGWNSPTANHRPEGANPPPVFLPAIITYNHGLSTPPLPPSLPPVWPPEPPW